MKKEKAITSLIFMKIKSTILEAVHFASLLYILPKLISPSQATQH